MTQYSYSRIDTYEQCPLRYKFHYIDKLEPIYIGEYNDPLICGSVLHKCLESGWEAGYKEYCEHFHVLNNEAINALIKIQDAYKKALPMTPTGRSEIQISTDNFIGFVDLLAPLGGNEWEIYDFKYMKNNRNAKNGKIDSPQLHLYKYYLEKMMEEYAMPITVSKLKYMFIYKTDIKPWDEQEEILESYRLRLEESLCKQKIEIKEIGFNPDKIRNWKNVRNATREQSIEYTPNLGWWCLFCHYQMLCDVYRAKLLASPNPKVRAKVHDVIIMELPSIERRTMSKMTKKRMWLYGAPFSGKTYLANQFPNPLMLNTDGNVNFVDAPFMPIRDEVVGSGNLQKRKFAWEVLKDVIFELEKGHNQFNTIVVDLIDDLYTMCRVYIYDLNGWKHEQDGGFGKGYDAVQTEFLEVMRRIVNLNYDNIILISHSDEKKDVTKRSGAKVQTIEPVLKTKFSNKLAGMVDIVGHMEHDNDKYQISFKVDEFTFGGSRLPNANGKIIDSSYESICQFYDDCLKNGNVESKKVILDPRKEGA